MLVISPIAVTNSILSTTCPEEGSPFSGGGVPLWVSGTNYAVNAEVYLSSTHRVYKSATSGVSTVSPNLDPLRWTDMRPTNLWAPFDTYTSTTGYFEGPVEFILNLTGYWWNSVTLIGLTTTTYSYTVSAYNGNPSTGGTLLKSVTGYAIESPSDWYQYLFERTRSLNRFFVGGFSGANYVKISLQGYAPGGISYPGGSTPTGVGMIAIGYAESVAGTYAWGGTQYGASAEPVTYSYIKTNDDGTTTIVKRHSATNLRASVTMPKAQADRAVSLLQSVLDVPAVYVATEVEGHKGLIAYGLGNFSVSYDSYGDAKASINVKGMI